MLYLSIASKQNHYDTIFCCAGGCGNIGGSGGESFIGRKMGVCLSSKSVTSSVGPVVMVAMGFSDSWLSENRSTLRTYCK